MILKTECGNTLMLQQVMHESGVYRDFNDGSIYNTNKNIKNLKKQDEVGF